MKRILIVDDEPHVVRILRQALDKAGYDVDTACNGVIALEKITQQAPDILIADIQMPKMTGQELCQRIQEELPEREFLIFIVTSRTEIEHREWSSRIDNLIFLEKPISVRQLLNKLYDYFN